MEVASNVRDFLVGMEQPLSPDKEALLSKLQDLHEQYLALTTEFEAQVSKLALSISPEARVVAHKLRVRIYQDWRVKLMDRIFANPADASIHDEASTTCDHSDTCVCALSWRLEMYANVIEEFLAASPNIHSTPGVPNPEYVTRLYETPDNAEFAIDEGIVDQLFVFPEFLRSSALA